jgi:putative FmdB family regulatory protein
MSIKVTYSGSGFPRPFDYKCPECGHICVIVQRPIESMDDHDCPSCHNAKLMRYLTHAPSFGADWHESQKSHNLNWD